MNVVVGMLIIPGVGHVLESAFQIASTIKGVRLKRVSFPSLFQMLAPDLSAFKSPSSESFRSSRTEIRPRRPVTPR